MIPYEAQQALDALSAFIGDLNNVTGRAAGKRPTEWRDEYLIAVDGAEQRLQHSIDLPTWLQQVHTSRYWQIRNTGDGSARPYEMIAAEIRYQLQHAQALVKQLEAVAEQHAAASPEALGLVLDTNIALHYRGYDEIRWLDEVHSAAVRLIVPLPVVHELDNKKNGGGKLGQRAGRVLALLRRDLAGAGRGPAPVAGRDVVTIEVPLGFDDLASGNTDQDVIETASLLNRLGNASQLVTGDMSMQLRAGVAELSVHLINDKWRLPPLKDRPPALPDASASGRTLDV